MHAKYHSKSGFTLIELLAVITIMAILLSIGAVGIKNVGKAQGTTAGAAVAEALMEEARTLAISRGTEARLVINATNTNINGSQISDGKYLREMYVVYLSLREKDPAGNITKEEWTRASRATMLPDKTFFDVDASRQGFGDNAGGSGTGAIVQASNLKLDGGNPSTLAKVYYYEFNSEGICQSPGASFVCVEGVLAGGQVQGKGDNKAGFVVWRNGRTSIIRDTSSL